MKYTTVTVVANVVDEKTKKHFAVLKFKPDGKRSFRKLVELAELLKPYKMFDLLRNWGVKIPVENKDALRFLEKNILTPQAVPPTKTMRHQTGWFGDREFVMKDQTINQIRSTAVHYSQFSASPVNGVKTSRSLAEWKKSLALITGSSRIGLFMMAHAFSGPLLRFLLAGPDQPIFNLRQKTSCGKTSLLLLGHTIFGEISGSSDLTTFDHTARALEEILMDHNDLFVAFDEENRSGGTDDSATGNAVLRKFGFIAAAGRGRRRSNSVGDILPEASWHCAIGTSSNRKTSNTTGEDESNSPSGVRWIDLLVGDSNSGGIFDRKDCNFDVDRRNRILNKSIAGCLENQGTAGREWLKHLVDTDKRQEILTHTRLAQKSFIKKYSVGLTNAQFRILSKFALVYAVASVLPDLGIVPWSKLEGEAAVRYVYMGYIRERRSEYVDKKIILNKVAKLISNTDDYPSFSRARSRWSKAKQTVPGFNTTFKDERIICLTVEGFNLLAKKFEISSEALEAILRAEKLMMRDADGKWSIFTKSPESAKRKRYIALRLNALKAVSK